MGSREEVEQGEPMSDDPIVWADGYPPPNPGDWAGPENESDGIRGEREPVASVPQAPIASVPYLLHKRMRENGT